MIEVVQSFTEGVGEASDVGVNVGDHFDDGREVAEVTEVSEDLDNGFFGLLIEAHYFLVKAKLFKEPQNRNLLVGFCVSVVLLKISHKVENF